ncbi:MbtH family protein [Streptomyces phaeochromogenes]|uniref:MbtH family protein n=1 Tax=Streptomyces phaeochromogenes TaxID=1923 RepID=UPI00225A11E3|nr:MbtH family protein [Streptomyces phaeochromogenes]MCX5605583.1 MbtH family protein [Streptomyces phaeochromogenes]
MSTQPFEDQDAAYHVLVNEEGQHSLWPAFADVPAGWTVVLHQAGRQACIDYVNTHWTDMRPRSLRRRMA